MACRDRVGKNGGDGAPPSRVSKAYGLMRNYRTSCNSQVKPFGVAHEDLTLFAHTPLKIWDKRTVDGAEAKVV